jgi:hypothetical protein
MGCQIATSGNYSEHEIDEECQLRKFEVDIGAFSRNLNNILPKICIEKDVIPVSNLENLLMKDFNANFIQFIQQGFFFKELNGVTYYDARKIDLLLFLLTNDSVVNAKVSYQCKSSFVFTFVKTRDDQNLNEPLEENEENFVKFVEDVVEVACVGIPQCYLSVKNENKEGLIKNLKEVQADAVKRIIADLFETKDKNESAGLSFDDLNKKFEKNDRLLTSGFVREYAWRILQQGKANDIEKKEREMNNTKKD